METREYAVSKTRRVVILGTFCIVLAGLFVLKFSRREVPPVPPQPLSEEATSSSAGKLQFSIPQGFDAKSVTTLTDDLRGDGMKETVLCAMPEQSATPPHESYIAVFEPIDGGKYKKDADNFFRNDDGYAEPICAGAEAVQMSTSTASGKILVLGLGTGGAATESYGFFEVRWNSGKVVQIPVEEPDGTSHLDGFLKGSAALHSDDFIFRDLNKDGGKELVRESALYKGSGAVRYSWNWDWKIEVYLLRNGVLSYDAAITKAKRYGLLLEFQKAVLPAS